MSESVPMLSGESVPSASTAVLARSPMHVALQPTAGLSVLASLTVTVSSWTPSTFFSVRDV